MLTKFCKSKEIKITLVILLIMTMTLANVLFLGKSLISYAVESNLEMQGEDTQSSNVKFDAFFRDSGGNNIHSVVFDVINDIPIINLHLTIKNTGYLKEAYIDFRDEENSTNTNYEISSDISDTTLVQSVNEKTKTMSLNYINYGTDVIIQMPISFEHTDLMELSKLKQNSLITLRGIYVDKNGKEIDILKTIKLNLGWTTNSSLTLNQSVVKFVPYINEETSGVILQTKVELTHKGEKFVLPVAHTSITVNVPTVGGTLPEKITAIAESTMATNGNKVKFDENNITYNEENKTVRVENDGYNENSIAWAGEGTDVYLITYEYPSEAYENAYDSKMSLECNANMSLYSGEEYGSSTSVVTVPVGNSMIVGEMILNHQIGDMVTYNIEAKTQEISKGKMYANYNSNVKTYDTEYTLKAKANISKSELVEELTMQLPVDNFMQGEREYLSNSQYKQIKISKEKLQELFGTDGYINIVAGQTTYIINNETRDKDGFYEINFEDKLTDIIIKTSRPIKNGILEVDITKAISKDLAYSKAQVKQFETLNGKGYTINLLETSSNAKLEISDTSLIAGNENKNVEFKITLNNNIEKSDLYKNAKFMIQLPKYIEDIEVVNKNILYTSGLQIDHIDKKQTENGIMITIYTTGAEKTFSEGMFTNGTNIILNTNIKVNKETPDITDKITFNYINESAVAYENDGNQEVEVNFIKAQETNLDDEKDEETPIANTNLEMNTQVLYNGEEITENDAVKEYQTITYKTTVKNTSKVTAEGVELTGTVENGTIEKTTNEKINNNEVTLDVGSIPAGEEKTVLYSARVASAESEDSKLQATTTVTADNYENELADTKINRIEEAKLRLSYGYEYSATIINGNEKQTYISLENISGATINNIVITQKLPEGLEFETAYSDDVKYDEATKTIQIKIDSLEDNERISRTIDLRGKTEGTGKAVIGTAFTATADEIGTYTSNTIEFEIVSSLFNININSNLVNGSYIEDGDKIEISGTVQNIGGKVAKASSVMVQLPNEFEVDEAYYLRNDEKIEMNYTANNGRYFGKDIGINETVTFNIIATARILENISETEVSVMATVEDNDTQKDSNTLNFTIEKTIVPDEGPNWDDFEDDNPADPTDPTTPEDPTIRTYRISGTAWLDKNKDGKIDSDEDLLEGINVTLIDSTSGAIVLDRTNGQKKETKTLENGKYTFSNLLPGTYMVIFEYDSNYYELTEYEKSGVTEDLSSKVIEATIKKDGTSKIAGVTNTIEILDSSKANINIGLIEIPKFDLSLKNELSKVTIANASGIKTYNFDNPKLGKIDIPAKYISTTMATIEYKITVKNEGAVAGSVKKIVDYISNDLVFDAEINPGWYKGSDGNLYNNTLTNVVLNPGETKELTLILTKQMTNENTGTIINIAEIYEDYNELGIKDYNSNPGNNSQDENDLDYASLIITVKTGQVIIFTTITIICIAIIAIGAYQINKRVLRGGKN